MARQMPLAEKIPYADYVIDTSGSKAETVSRAREVWDKLKEEAAARRP
jgi:dephospho-CoA kinase